MHPRVEIDYEAHAAYIALSDVATAQTEEVAGGVLVDLDQFGVVRGIEVLSLDADIPVADLTARFHLRPEAVAALHRIQPSVTSFVARAVDGNVPTRLAAQVGGFQVA